MIKILLLDIHFCMNNNLNIIIKIFSTTYLLRVVLFNYFQLEGMPIFLIVIIWIMSLGSTKLDNLSLKRLKIGWNPSLFLNNY